MESKIRELYEWLKKPPLASVPTPSLFYEACVYHAAYLIYTKDVIRILEHSFPWLLNPKEPITKIGQEW